MPHYPKPVPCASQPRLTVEAHQSPPESTKAINGAAGHPITAPITTNKVREDVFSRPIFSTHSVQLDQKRPSWRRSDPKQLEPCYLSVSTGTVSLSRVIVPTSQWFDALRDADTPELFFFHMGDLPKKGRGVRACSGIIRVSSLQANLIFFWPTGGVSCLAPFASLARCNQMR